MARPTFILAEPEPDEALSTRKLVLETGKFNVITAYTGKEAIELIELYPRIDGVILHDQLAANGCNKAASALKKRLPEKPLIVLGSGHGTGCKLADHVVSSHEPQALLTLLRDRFGDPKPNGHARKKNP